MGVMPQASSSVSQSSSEHRRFMSALFEIHRNILDCSSTSAGGVRLGNVHHLDNRSSARPRELSDRTSKAKAAG